MIEIGANCWIGASSIIMASVGFSTLPAQVRLWFSRSPVKLYGRRSCKRLEKYVDIQWSDAVNMPTFESQGMTPTSTGEYAAYPDMTTADLVSASSGQGRTAHRAAASRTYKPFYYLLLVYLFIYCSRDHGDSFQTPMSG